MPQRELRLLVDGIQGWLARIATKDGSAPGSLGFLEGEPGQGQRELLRALHVSCRESGIHVLRCPASAPGLLPPGGARDLALQCLRLDANLSEAQGSASRFSPEILSEIRKVARRGGSPPRGAEPSISIGPRLDRSRLVDGLARSFFELSARAPTLLLVEELTSLDPVTREVFCQLIRILAIRRFQKWVPRLLVIAAVPPEFDLSSFGELRDAGLYELEAFRVRTRGLSRDDLKDIASSFSQVQGTLSFRERVLQVTGGNVRYTKWLLWNLEEQGGLKSSAILEGRPDFVALVKERFSRLSILEKRAVGFLAAAGVPCSPKFVESALRDESGGSVGHPPVSSAGTPATEIPSVVGLASSLVARGWLVATPDLDSVHFAGTNEELETPPGVVFAIADELVAETVLESLPAQERVGLHGLLGSEFKQLGARDDLWLPLAFGMFQLAGDLEAAGGVLEPALTALEALGSTDSALLLLEDLIAAELAAGKLPRIDLQLRRAELLTETRNFREAIDAYVSLSRSPLEAEVKSRVFRLLGDLHARLQEHELSIQAYGEGLRCVEGSPGSLERLKLLAAFARFQLETKQLDLSLSYLDQCLEVVASQGLSSDANYIEVYRLAEEVHFHRSDYVEAAEFERCLLRLCETSGNILGILKSQRHLAHLHALRNEWDDAAAYLLDSVRLAKSTGSRWLYARALGAYGHLQRNRRDPEGALKSLRRAHFLLLDLGKTECLGQTVSAISGLELELGHFDAAAQAIRAYLSGWDPSHEEIDRARTASGDNLSPLPRRKKIRQLEKKCSRSGRFLEDAEVVQLSTLLEADGRLSDAHNVCRASLRREPPLAPELLTKVCFALGRISAHAGDYDSALSRFEGALERDMGPPHREALAIAYLEAGSVFLTRGDLARSFEYLRRGVCAALEVGTVSVVLLSLECMGRFLEETGQCVPALSVAQDLIEAAGVFRLPSLELSGWRLLARTQAGHGNPEAAQKSFRRWKELVDRLELPIESARFKLEAGWLAFYELDFEGALKQGREGIQLARTLGLSPLVEEFLHLLGVVESSSSNPRKNFLRALEALEQAMGGSEARKCPRLRWEVLGDISQVYLLRGKDDLSEAYRQRAEEIELIVKSSLPRPIKHLRWRRRVPVQESIPV